MKKILFVLKRREGYGLDYAYGFASGLSLSSEFIMQMLQRSGYECKIAVVPDNNSIDREVHQFRPDVVIIEALWVVPEKFDVLKKLHPTVEWVVRIHSAIPFLAQEGAALSWVKGYVDREVFVACNEVNTFNRIVAWLSDDYVVYLPNWYPISDCTPKKKSESAYLDVGCFGAIRVLKNQLLQAMIAIEVADDRQKYLRFHINRAFHGGEAGHNVLKNLRARFEGTRHQLIEHEWLNHEQFMNIVRAMDLGLQISFSETFNIVTADFVDTGIPVVVSREIAWVGNSSKVDSTDESGIKTKIANAWGSFNRWRSTRTNKKNLERFVDRSEKIWLRFLR